MAQVTTNQNFVNPAFGAIFNGITRNMPAITFWGIIVTYAITASLNVWAIKLPIYISLPTALAIQFGRFAIVFMDFLNPTGKRSTLPGIIATFGTAVALAEYSFSLQTLKVIGPEFWSLFLFGGMVVLFGYLLEINFIRKGAEAFGLTSGEDLSQGAVNTAAKTTTAAAPMDQHLIDQNEFLKDQLKALQSQMATLSAGNGQAPARPNRATANLGHLNGQLNSAGHP